MRRECRMAERKKEGMKRLGARHWDIDTYAW